jgi:ketosteroid isomerase-like protein
LKRAVGIISALLLSATSAMAQVIPGQGMGHNMRSDLIEYRARVRNDLASLSETWAAAWEKKDAKALAAIFDKEARLIVHKVATSGPDAAAKQLVELAAAGGHASLTVDDFATSGDYAFVSGVITVQPPSSGGTLGTVEGSYQLIAANDGFGKWRIRSLLLDL